MNKQYLNYLLGFYQAINKNYLDSSIFWDILKETNKKAVTLNTIDWYSKMINQFCIDIKHDKPMSLDELNANRIRIK